jgi:hypothetical protein
MFSPHELEVLGNMQRMYKLSGLHMKAEVGRCPWCLQVYECTAKQSL